MWTTFTHKHMHAAISPTRTHVGEVHCLRAGGSNLPCMITLTPSNTRTHAHTVTWILQWTQQYTDKHMLYLHSRNTITYTQPVPWMCINDHDNVNNYAHPHCLAICPFVLQGLLSVTQLHLASINPCSDSLICVIHSLRSKAPSAI